MTLTPKGSHAEMFERRQKENLAHDLILGLKDVQDYMKGVCYDAVAYVMHLQNSADITYNDIINTKSNDWMNIFSSRREWTGGSIPEGTAVGFYRVISGSFFHAALGTGGTRIRAINGLSLGAGWVNEVNLVAALGARNEDGTYNHDRTKIRVYLMSI